MTGSCVQFFFKSKGSKKWRYCHGVWGRPIQVMVVYWEKDKFTGIESEQTRFVKYGDKIKVKYIKEK